MNKRLLIKGTFGWNIVPILIISYCIFKNINLKPFVSYAKEPMIYFILGVFGLYYLTYSFLKRTHIRHMLKDLWSLGLVWGGFFIIFQAVSVSIVYDVSLKDIMSCYNIFKGEPWPWIITFIVICPRLTKVLV